MKPKVIIIGLDGGTLSLFEQLAERGVMPNFAELVKKGCSGTLKSTTPPYTPPAWTSFYTGVNPGKHGIFGFTWLNPETRNWDLPSSKIIGAKKLWHILNEQGVRTGLINLPLTYPPEPVDGFMVTGMMTPDKAPFTYPESLADDVARLPEKYSTDYTVYPISDALDLRAAKNIHSVLKGRRAGCLHFMRRYDCDLFMTVFITPDRLQHVYWKYVDKNSNLYDTAAGEEFRKEILPIYRMLDDTIGDIMCELDSGATIFLMSDHGFTEQRSEFFLNNWLVQEGYLSLDSSSNWMLKASTQLRSLVPKKFLGLLSGSLGAKVKEKGFKHLIDWEKSVAYTHEQGLYLNLPSGADSSRYRELRGEIAEKLRLIDDPISGRKIVDSVTFKDDIYEGPFFDIAPDIVPVIDGYRGYIYDGVLRKKLLVDHTLNPNGMHHPAGLFLAYGSDILPDTKVENAEIIDVTPTVLHTLGLPVPEHMDGRVLEEIFLDEFIDRNPVRGSDAQNGSGKYDSHADVYSAEETKQIEEQLRGMGYIS